MKTSINLSWIILLLLSFFWTGAVHIFEPPLQSWSLLLLAFLLSLVSYWLSSEKSFIAVLKKALSHCLLVLSAQAAIFPFCYLLMARSHGESFFASLISPILNLFGIPTVAEGSILTIDSTLRTLVFSSSWEKAGLLYLLLLLAGGLVTLALHRARPHQFASFAGFTFLYGLVRYAFLVMLYTTYNLHSLFWERALSFVSFLPYALILTYLWRKLPLPDFALSPHSESKSTALTASALAFLLVFSAVSFFGLRDPGREKQGRLLVDEYHSDWEWTTDTYDEQWFGERSGYNYYCFFNYLEKYYPTERNMGAIGPNTLQDVDVFIMKTPTKPFEPEEIDYIVSFVEAGGGLYLIGDHTNVFGTGTNLNQLSKTFGITFNYDCTYELRQGSLSEYDAPRLLPHPAVQNLPHFLFATSNTLDAKWQADEVIIGYGLKNLPADYSQKNFFPADTNAPSIEFGLFLQSAAVPYGKGRVLAFTDSTVFSNFWMFMPGKPELLLGSIQWLNRENLLLGITTREIALACLVVMLIITILWAYRQRRSFPLVIFLLSALASVLISGGFYHVMGRLTTAPPQPIQPMTRIRFEREYSQYQLPDDLQGFMSNMDEQLNTFYVWTQRLDYYPSVDSSLLTALRSGELAVMAKPDRDIDRPQRVLDEVEQGAALLILDHLDSGGYSNSLLELIDMELTEAEMAATADYRELKNIPLTVKASVIKGGEPLILDANGRAICSVKRLGKGLIAVFSDPDLFYNWELGDVSANLNEKTDILTRLEFQLLRELIENIDQ